MGSIHHSSSGFVIASLAAIVASAAFPAMAQDCAAPIGHWANVVPAYVAAVTVAGDRLYFGDDSGLMVAELSDPAAPEVVGRISLPETPQNIEISGGFAYVADGPGGLRIIDVRNPTAPDEVGSFSGDVWDVALKGDYAYVVGEDVLRVVDVSSPSAPFEVGSVVALRSSSVAVEGHYAFVNAWANPFGIGSLLLVIDISSPSSPFRVTSHFSWEHIRDVAVSDGYLYVAEDSGLKVFDITPPNQPRFVGWVEMPSAALRVSLAGGYAYVADSTGGLRLIDVSTPSNPVEVGFLDTPVIAVAVAGSYAYVGESERGLRVVDVSTPESPVEVGPIGASVVAVGVAVDGDQAFVGLQPSGFRVLNISDLASPVEVGSVDTPGIGLDVAAASGYVFVASSDHGLRVIDVSTPSTPVAVGFAETPGDPLAVSVRGGHAFVADDTEGLRVIDVSVPASPVEVGSIVPPGPALDVAASGHFAFLAAAEAGLRIIDVSAPSAPVEAGSILPPGSGSALGVDVSGRYAYLAYGEGGLWVIDVSTPSAPVEVGHWSGPGPISADHVAVDHGYANVTLSGGDSANLLVLDVSTPSAPVEVERVSFDEVESVAASGGRVVLTQGSSGLTVLAGCRGGASPDGRESYVPAAAVAAGAEGAFFSTDLEVNNTGSEGAEVRFQWLPRGQDNSEPLESEPIAIGPGQSLRFENVLAELFGLEPDSVGALKMVADTESVIGMSRTYNIPAGKAAGTFGQGLPAIRATEMLSGTEPWRMTFFSEDSDSRANLGCINGSSQSVRVSIEVVDAGGNFLETMAMDLEPYSNNQINRVFGDYQPVNGYVDVWADRDDALYYCYGSMLDNGTSDPTTILPQRASSDTSFVPAAALASGREGSFFRTDVDLNNVGSTRLTYRLLWLPRGADNSEAIRSETFSLAPGVGARYANVLDEVFGLAPEQLGALSIEASGADLLAMSRTYNLPTAKVAGTFGQELPGIPADKMIPAGVRKRIVFMNENDDVRSNVGCQNGSSESARVFIELFNAQGEPLETKRMNLEPYSNNQLTRVFRDYAPIAAGYVDVWTDTEGATFYCYGSVLDNVTSDPTTVLPQ